MSWPVLGFDLILNYRTNAEAAALARKECEAILPGIKVLTFKADIADATARAELIAFARANFDRLDFLVNNAGVAPEHRADLLEETEQDFDRLLRINLKGPYFLTQLGGEVDDRTAPGGKFELPSSHYHDLIDQRLYGLYQSRHLLPLQGCPLDADVSLRHTPRRVWHQCLRNSAWNYRNRYDRWG